MKKEKKEIYNESYKNHVKKNCLEMLNKLPEEKKLKAIERFKEIDKTEKI